MSKLQDVKIIITDFEDNIVADNNQYSDYSFDSNYMAVADAFNLTLVNVQAKIKPGYGLQFYINNKIAFNGIIQRIDKAASKRNIDMRISGKDRASILIESYCNNFKDFYNEKPKNIIDSLIGQTNFYTKQKGSIEESEDTTGFNSPDDIDSSNEAVLLDTNNNDTLSTITDETVYDADFTALANRKNFKIDIGDQVYDKIYDLVKSSGFEVLYQENGELYIGDLIKKRYADQVTYNITFRYDGNGNNVETSNSVEDISGRYSTIQISSQSESYEYDSNFPYVNKTATAIDNTLQSKKFFAANINGSEESPEKTAIQIREDMRQQSFSLNYNAPGHIADNGEFWKINRYVNVFDEVQGIREHLVLYGRTFIFNMREGSHTILRLGRERINDLVLGES